MGIVYEAIDSSSNQRVALKVLQSHVARNASARARFEGEMRILAELQHPCVVRSLGAETMDGRLVLVLEYLEGRTLRETLTAHGPLRPEHAVSIARQIASALVAAHERPRPIVHRDLKPENLMLLPGGAVKVMDFGVAKVLHELGGVSHTTQAIGTARYLSPEQADGSGITHKVDVYGLGLVLYEMVTGVAPFDGPSLAHIVQQHCFSPPPALSEAVRAQIPAELEALMFALLAKRPDERPGAASALATLARIAEAPRPAGPTVAAATGAPRRERPAFASPTQPPTGAPALVTPHAGSAPSGRVGGLDTVALIDRRTKRRAWPVVAGIAALVAVGGGITAAVLLLKSSAASQASSASARARIAPTPNLPFPTAPEPTVTRDVDCPPATCRPFAPPDPKRIPFDLALRSATEFARSLDATAKLSSFSLRAPFRAAEIDLTVEGATMSATFEGTEKRTVVRFSASKLETGSPGSSHSLPLPEPFCSLAQAETAARVRGMTFDVATRALLTVSPVNDEGVWIFDEGDRPHQRRHALVTAKTCAVRSFRQD